MPLSPPTNRDRRDQDCSSEAILVDLVREEKMAANPEAGNQDERRDTMHNAKPGKADANLIKPALSRAWLGVKQAFIFHAVAI